MKNFFARPIAALSLITLLFACAMVLAPAAESSAQAKAPSAPHPSLKPITDTPGLPRVLLIGDSISMGYTLPVRAQLAGKANVHRPLENCGDTKRGLDKLDAWLGTGRWDVIHFNFGLHDLKYLDEKGKYVNPPQGHQVASPAQYEANLKTLIVRLKKTGARLIFATTTPVPAGTLGRIEHDEAKYNEVAVKVAKDSGIGLDDLHALVVPRQAQLQRPKNVHYTPEGYEALGEAVAKKIEEQLPAR